MFENPFRSILMIVPCRERRSICISMKILWGLLFFGLFLTRCGDPEKEESNSQNEEEALEDEAREFQKIIAEAPLQGALEKRGTKENPIIYVPGDDQPYTGWNKRLHENGKVAFLVRCIDGKEDGPYFSWHKSGIKRSEGTCKNGMRHGVETRWNTKGQKTMEVTFRNGKQDGPEIAWHNGQIIRRVIIKDGKEVEE